MDLEDFISELRSRPVEIMLAEWSIFGLFASVFAVLLFARQFLYQWLQVGALSHKLILEV